MSHIGTIRSTWRCLCLAFLLSCFAGGVSSAENLQSTGGGLPLGVAASNSLFNTSNFVAESALSVNGIEYFIGHYQNQGDALWRYSDNKSRIQRVPLPGYQPALHSKPSMIQTESGELWVYSRDDVWRIPAGQFHAQQVAPGEIEEEFYVSEVLPVKNQVFLTLAMTDADNRHTKSLWRFNEACNCLTDYMVGQYIDRIVEFNGVVLAVEHEYENNAFTGRSLLYHLDIQNDQLSLITNSDPRLDDIFYAIDLHHAITWNENLFFMSTDSDGRGYLWRYDLQAGDLLSLSTVNSLIYGDQFEYFPEILAHQDNLLVVQRSVRRKRDWHESHATEKKLFIYDMGDDTVTHVADLKHQFCWNYEGEDFYLIPSPLTAKVLLDKQDLYYVSDEQGSGFKLWHYHIPDAKKTDITPKAFSDTSQEADCASQDFFTDNLYQKNDELYFFTRKFDAKNDAFNSDLTGLWRLNTDTFEVSQLHSPEAGQTFTHYSSLHQLGDDYVFTSFSSGRYEYHKSNELWHLASETGQLSPVLDPRNEPLRGGAFLDVNQQILISANGRQQERQLFKLETSGAAMSLAQPAKANTNLTTNDFDGDGISDVGFRETVSGAWNIVLSGNSQHRGIRFGLHEKDIPVPADYDGDGITDIAFRRPSNQTWYVLNSSGSNYNSDNEDGIQRTVMGMAEDDIPIPADYDGDGIDDMAVRRPSWQAYIIRHSSTGQTVQVKFGLSNTDIPVTGDFDGDGKADVAFLRTGNKTWYVQNSSGSNYNSDNNDNIQRIGLGWRLGDVPTPADFDGDGITDIAIWRASQSRFVVRYSTTGDVALIDFNNASEAIPVVGDYNGDGLADTALYFASTGTWLVRDIPSEQDTEFYYPADASAFPLSLPLTEVLKRLQSKK